MGTYTTVFVEPNSTVIVFKYSQGATIFIAVYVNKTIEEATELFKTIYRIHPNTRFNFEVFEGVNNYTLTEYGDINRISITLNRRYPKKGLR